ncbi:hypothetical protein [Mucilaginibacter flavus]|uniref:hypothetical protein n=1 Tax=Mucilaginibacter flavus TaxID=931504 RepID=UPI0025B292A9|nr:hypothetical protein [Mucilaginibacter flavus]MDN3583602.1 hypothetical protein [Mucilaginibacter flavus]
MPYLKHLFLPVIFLGCLTARLNAQPLKPADYGLKEFSLQDKKLGLIRFYVSTENIQKKKPLFIEVNGSGGLPLCVYIKGKGFGATLNTFNSQLKDATKNQFHYIVLGKPGTPFCDSISTPNDIKHYDEHALISSYAFSKEYNQRLSLNWRVQATKKVISYLITHRFWNRGKIVAYGYSEGGQVVPSLAVADKRVTHIIPVVGSGLNQFYDRIIGWRIKAAHNEVTQQQAQDSIDANLKQIKDIYRHPESSTLQYDGHSYKRWASFGLNPPFEKLRMLHIPIYMIVSTADNNSPIYGLDYVLLDFMRLGKTNLTYDPCVGCDHYLNSTDSDKTVKQTEYTTKILTWLNRH